MKKNKNKLGLFLLALLMCFAFTGIKATAATIRTAAYVDTSKQALIWKAYEFCSSGYSYKIVNDETGNVIATGSISKTTTVGNGRLYQINLGSKYADDKWYSLTVTGKDRKKSYTVRYRLPGSKNLLKSASVAQTSQDTLKAAVSLSSGISGAVEFRVYAGTNSISLMAETKLTKTSTTSLSGTIPGTKLANNVYRAYVVLTSTHGGKIYYGPGKEASCSFLKKQYKVSGLRVSRTGAKAKLTWTAAKNASYYKIYRSNTKSGTYTCIKSGVTATSFLTNTLSGGKAYYFKVEAIGKAGKSVKSGGLSAAKGVKIPVLPGKVSGFKFALNMDNQLVMKWNKTSNTTGYRIYYKRSTSSAFKKLATTKNREYILSKLKSGTTYNLKIVAYRKSGSNVIWAAQSSKILTINPKKYIKAHRQQLLAAGVRTIGYIGKSREVYTTRKYTAERRLAFVNYKGYSSSTNYLIWISHYTQQVTIYKGHKGHWKIIRTCTVATGKASTRSPRGVYKIRYKENGWFYASTKELYVTHWCGRNSFHTRPLWNDGSVCTPTIGRPVSHGCVRMYNEDARYIYNNMPKGTTVISY